MSSRMECPHCQQVLNAVKYRIDYCFTGYGECRGSLDVEDADDDRYNDLSYHGETEDNDSDNYEYEEPNFYCTACNRGIEWSYIRNARESDLDIYREGSEDEPVVNGEAISLIRQEHVIGHQYDITATRECIKVVFNKCPHCNMPGLEEGEECAYCDGE